MTAGKKQLFLSLFLRLALAPSVCLVSEHGSSYQTIVVTIFCCEFDSVPISVYLRITHVLIKVGEK